MVLEMLRAEVSRRYTTTVRRALEACEDGESPDVIARQLRHAARRFDREPGFGRLARYVRNVANWVEDCAVLEGWE